MCPPHPIARLQLHCPPGSSLQTIQRPRHVGRNKTEADTSAKRVKETTLSRARSRQCSQLWDNGPLHRVQRERDGEELSKGRPPWDLPSPYVLES
ncbi:unnamed protein product [Caretta caretta]